jgi:hypothetical protein
MHAHILNSSDHVTAAMLAVGRSSTFTLYFINLLAFISDDRLFAKEKGKRKKNGPISQFAIILINPLSSAAAAVSRRSQFSGAFFCFVNNGCSNYGR